MHVLVTGGAGFIGSHMVEYHLARGDRVHVVDDLSTGQIENLRPFLDRPDFHFDRADLLTWPELSRVAAWADRVVHLAAVVGMLRVLAEPIRVLAINIAATERLLRAVDDGGWRPQVLVASSSEVYGPRAEGVLDEDADLTLPSGAVVRWNYAVSKLADEALALSYARKREIPITVVRFFNTIGPRQRGRYGMVVPRFVTQAVTGEPITVFGDGHQSRSFCDVRDTVTLLDELASNPESAGQIVNVGNDHELSIVELARKVKERAGSDSEILHIPYQKAYGDDFEEVPCRRPQLHRLHRLTRHRHCFELEDTLDDLIARARRRPHHEGLETVPVARQAKTVAV